MLVRMSKTKMPTIDSGSTASQLCDLGELLNLFVPQFFHRQNGYNNCTCLLSDITIFVLSNVIRVYALA